MPEHKSLFESSPENPINHDIEDYFKTRQIFESVWESSIDAMRLCNDKGIMIYVNRAFCELFEKPESELLGYEFTTLQKYDPEHYKTLVNNFRDTLNNRELKYRFEAQFTLWNGKNKWLEISNSFIEFNDDLLLLSIFRDVSQRKNAEISLLKAKEKAEESNLLKSAFLANMSHELRTPLIGIMGFTEILQEKLSDEADLGMLGKVMKSSQRLLKTFESIFDLSLLESNRKDFKLTPVSVTNTLKIIYDEYCEIAEQKGLAFFLDMPKEDILGFLDERILLKIFQNLVDNAIKYTQLGSVKLSLKLREGSIANFALITVEDTGIGIPEAGISFVFDAFRQVSEGYDRSFEGNGLGLTLTKKFVQFLGGTISVESKVDIGSKFSITLPLNSSESDSKMADGNSFIQNKQKPTILIVDDDSIARDVMKLILYKEYDFEEASNYESTMKLLDEKKFDLILLDIMLGREKMGITIAKELKGQEKYQGIPIVAVTALAMTGDKEIILNSGCSSYISKPFRKSELLKIISESLGKKI